MTNNLERRVSKLEGSDNSQNRIAWLFVDPVEEPGATVESKQAEYLAANPDFEGKWFIFELCGPTGDNDS